MFFAKSKKYVGLALAFSIVLGCFIFNPERANAESFLVLGKDYYLSEQNYAYCFGDYCAAIRFVPAETGYYLLDTDVYFDCFWFSEWAVNEDGTPKGYVYYDSKDNVQYFNLQLEYDPYKQQVYYFQKGYDYYFVHSKTGCYGADEGGFCLKRIEDYFQLRHNIEVDVIKDSSFECWASIVTTVECENVSFQWYKNHGEVLKTDTNTYHSEINVNSSDVFNEYADWDSEYSTSGQISCFCRYTIDGVEYSDWLEYCLTPHRSEWISYLWVKSEEQWPYFSNSDYENEFFYVSAGSDFSDCDISYQWYKSNWCGDDLEILPGETDSRLCVAKLGDPEKIFFSDDGWYYDYQDATCIVTFTKGDEIATKSLTFEASYGIDIKFNGSRSVLANNYGDEVSLPYSGSFVDPDIDDLSYEYQWYCIKNYGDYEGEEILGTGKSVTFDTSDLRLFHGDEGQYSSVYVRLLPKYDGVDFYGNGRHDLEFKIYYTDEVKPATSGIRIDEDHFPDERFRQYVSDNFDVNKSGYLSDSEIEAVTSIDVTNMMIGNMKGIRYFGNLEQLYCSGNIAYRLDLSGLANLTELRAEFMSLDEIDLSGCRSLKKAYLMHNWTPSINIDDCPYLKHAYMYGPQTATMANNKYFGLFENDSSDYYNLIYGLVIDEETVVENAIPFNGDETGLEVILQPRDFEGPIGNIATFHVEANKEDVEYQWQYRLPETDTYVNCTDEGCKTDTLTVPVYGELNGVKYRCLVSDGEVTVQSDYATLFVITYITIEKQPENYVGLEGSVAKFNVVAEGEGFTYQWQLKKGKTWANLTSGGATTDTLSVKVDASKNGKIYRCIITNDEGHTIATDEVSITVKEPSIKINTQPASFVGQTGATAKFTVDAEGEGLTYQWQLKKGSKWANLTTGGATTSSMSIKVDDSKNGKIYRCHITDANGEELATDEVSITVKEPDIVILTQPKSYVGTTGNTAKFTVEAEGEGLTYQWQLKKGSKWADLTSGGATTPTLSIKVDSSKDGKIYRCLITNAAGEELASQEASITIKEPDITIVKQPNDVGCEVGAKAIFEVEAEGEGLTYQWQLKKGSSWADLTSGGATTTKMTVKVDAGKFGKTYRCLITNAAGEQLATDEVQIVESKDHTDPLENLNEPSQQSAVSGEDPSESPVVPVPEPVQPNNSVQKIDTADATASEQEQANAPVEVPAPEPVSETLVVDEPVAGSESAETIG